MAQTINVGLLYHEFDDDHQDGLGILVTIFIMALNFICAILAGAPLPLKQVMRGEA